MTWKYKTFKDMNDFHEYLLEKNRLEVAVERATTRQGYINAMAACAKHSEPRSIVEIMEILGYITSKPMEGGE